MVSCATTRTGVSAPVIVRRENPLCVRIALLCATFAAVSSAPLMAAAEPGAHEQTARLAVSVTVVSTCKIASRPLDAQLDLRSALDISCADHAQVAQGPVRTLSSSHSAGRVVLATVNF